MTDTTTVIAKTNTTPNSCVHVNCTCDTMWSMAQQFSTVRLCTLTGENKGKLIRDYSVRARRIAATYARFYLEIEDGGNHEMMGRYYWMALGAFASKTVACTFETWQVKGMTPFDDTVWEGLGKGNFWLFCDISGWHWYRNMHPKSFDQCLHKRNAENYVRAVKVQLSRLPWISDALRLIKNFSVSNEIVAAFKKVDDFETATRRARPSIQLAHLLHVADHEQGVILQPLIYENRNFSSRVRLQREWYANWVAPSIELVFTHSCTSPDVDLKSVAPEGTELEILSSRMVWIGIAANQFHKLMQKKPDVMEGELKIIAGWSDMADSATTMEIIKQQARKFRQIVE